MHLRPSNNMAEDILKKAAPFIPLVKEAAAKYGVPPELMLGMLAQESRFNPVAVGPNTKYGTAKGIAQFIDATAQRFGVNQMDPRSSIDGMGKYLQVLGGMFNNDPSLMAAGYNAGEGRVKAANGIPQIPQTQDYVTKVQSFMPLFQQLLGGAPAASGQAAPAIAPQVAGQLPQPPGMNVQNLLSGVDPASLVPRLPTMGKGMQGLLTALATIGQLSGGAANIIGAIKGTGATGNSALKQSGDLFATVQNQRALAQQQEDMASLSSNPTLNPLLQAIASIGGREALTNVAGSAAREGLPSNQIAMARGIQDWQAQTPEGRAIASQEKVNEAAATYKATQPYRGIGEARAATASAMALRKEMNNLPDVKAAREMVQTMGGMESVWADYQKNPSKLRSATDQTLITTINKMLDPGSVVREGEYDRSEQGAPLINKLKSYQTKLSRGGVSITDADRRDIVETAKILFDGRMSMVAPTIEFYKEEAIRSGVDPERIINLKVPAEKETPGKALPKLEDLTTEQLKSLSKEELESYL